VDPIPRWLAPGVYARRAGGVVTYPKTCRKECLRPYRIGIVSNLDLSEHARRPLDLSRGHMSQSVCDRPECVKRAMREVLEFTGEQGTLYLDSERAS
jgi:hypothetical protein